MPTNQLATLGAEGDGWLVLGHQHPDVTIPNIDQWVGTQLGKVSGVVAVAITRSDGLRAVFSLVREHTDDTYDAILVAEAQIRKTLNGTRLSFSIRALQGRPVEEARPAGSKVVYPR